MREPSSFFSLTLLVASSEAVVVGSHSNGIFEGGKSQHLEREESVDWNGRPFAGLNPHPVFQTRAAEAFFLNIIFVGETAKVACPSKLNSTCKLRIYFPQLENVLIFVIPSKQTHFVSKPSIKI